MNELKWTLRSVDRAKGDTAAWTQYLNSMLPRGPYKVLVHFETGNIQGGVAQLQLRCDTLTRCLTTKQNSGGWFPIVVFRTGTDDPADGVFFLSDPPSYMSFQFYVENADTVYAPSAEERLIPMVFTHLPTGQVFHG